MRYFLSLTLTFFLSNLANSEATIEEVVVTVKQSENRALHPTIKLDHQALHSQTPSNVADILFATPSIGIRTNSRGETVFRLRGSEERQGAIFLDGAPLSVPWDGRIDLSTLPADIINRVEVIKSAAPMEYGPNAILGVVELTTGRSCTKGICGLRTTTGDHGQYSHSLFTGYNSEPWSISTAANFQSRPYLTVVDPEVISYAPMRNGRRLNTDNQSQTIWGSLNYDGDFLEARVSQLLISASRGVAPAGHLNPTVKLPRYWRYPDWDLHQTTANIRYNNSDWSYSATAWHQSFAQTIDQYTDATYNSLSDKQMDQDRTFGTRLIATLSAPLFDLRLIGNFQDTTHRQLNQSINPIWRGQQEIYKQKLYSLGGEFDIAPTDRLNISLGISHDSSETPQTGMREPQKKLDGWAGNLTLLWSVRDSLEITTTLGSRTRFPTLRELYGASLGKFLVNSELQPESAQLVDITVDWRPENRPVQLSITAWNTRIKNTLSKRKIVLDNSQFEQRYNMAGSVGQGIEIRALYELEKIVLGLNGSWQSFQADVAADGQRPDVLQRPETEYEASLNYHHSDSLSATISVQYIGNSKDENFDSEIVILPASTLVDAKVFFDIDRNWSGHLAVKNITDSLYLPQLGLPSTGRTVELGVRFQKQ